jgi:hypothetical protein
VKGQVIEFHSATIPGTRWIGVDLNTTGHVAVVADLFSGKVMKLGKNAPYVHSHWLKNCTTLWKFDKPGIFEQREHEPPVVRETRVEFVKRDGAGVGAVHVLAERQCCLRKVLI